VRGSSNQRADRLGLGDRSGPRTGVSRIKAMGIMDTWKRGRIIYAYLIWVVFKATTAGGLYGEYTFVSR